VAVVDGAIITGGMAMQALIGETKREIFGIAWLAIVRISLAPTLNVLSPS
jgi:hypothetical protein